MKEGKVRFVPDRKQKGLVKRAKRTTGRGKGEKNLDKKKGFFQKRAGANK